jgi:hypothetical protein
MRLAYVDRQKVGVILIVVVNLNDVADLATKRRSSVAAEDHHERPRTSAFPQMKVILAIQRKEPCIGRVISRMQPATMHVRQRVAQHIEGVLRAARHY